jgi:hypothetical protein
VRCARPLFNTKNGALRAPGHPIKVLLILPAKFMIKRKKPAKNPSMGKNPRKCGTALLLSYSSIKQLQVVL